MDGARVLVVGATGRLGGFLRAVWESEPPGFVPLWQTRHEGALAPGWCLWDPLAAGPMPRADAVLMLAGVTRGAAPELALNGALALAALATAPAAGARHVFLASSAAVYGATGADPVPETAPPAPARPYGRAKLAMERVAMAARRDGGPGLTALRIGNVAGADLLAQSMRGGGGLRLDRFAGSGRGPLRSYIGPVTLARVLAALLRRALAGDDLPETLNLAAPGAVAMEDLLAAAALPFTWQPAPPEAIERVVMATGLLESLVPLDLRDGEATRMVAEWRRLERRT